MNVALDNGNAITPFSRDVARLPAPRGTGTCRVMFFARTNYDPSTDKVVDVIDMTPDQYERWLHAEQERLDNSSDPPSAFAPPQEA